MNTMGILAQGIILGDGAVATYLDVFKTKGIGGGLFHETTRNSYRRKNFDKNNVEIDLQSQLIKHKKIICLETYKTQTDLSVIKIAIINENINKINKLTQYEFMVTLQKDKAQEITYKKTTGIISENHYTFQLYNVKNKTSTKRIIDCTNYTEKFELENL